MTIRDSENDNYVRHIQWGAVILLLLAFGLLAIALFLFKPDRSGQEQNALAFVRSSIKADYSADSDQLRVPGMNLDLIREALQDRSGSGSSLVVNGSLHVPTLQFFPATPTGTPTPTRTTRPSSTSTPVPTVTGTLPTATKSPTMTRTATVSKSATLTPSATVTKSATLTPTATVTKSATLTPSATVTRTPTQFVPLATQITVNPPGANPSPSVKLATANPPGFNLSPTVQLATVKHPGFDSSSPALAGRW